MAEIDDFQSRPRGRPLKSAYERQKMKAMIAETAKRLFQSEGYATVSMRRLSNEVGCSPMTLYKYYDGKIEILQSLWTVVFQDLFDELSKRLHETTDPKDRLSIACKFYVEYWLKHPEHYRLVFMVEGVTQPEVSMFIDDPKADDRFGVLIQTIIMASKKLSDETTMKIQIDLVMGALHGIAHNQITISGYPWSDAGLMVDHLIENLF